MGCSLSALVTSYSICKPYVPLSKVRLSWGAKIFCIGSCTSYQAMLNQIC